ncbi:MAG: guanitoxin biosynthesis heme-dependent pre-guanitoxin N-hydroxylase GntA [Caulobacterales bacterium]
MVERFTVKNVAQSNALPMPALPLPETSAGNDMSYFLNRRTLAPASASLRRQFEAFVRDEHFPCVAAKSALTKKQLQVVIARDITSAWDDLRLHEELRQFADEYAQRPTLFTSLVVIFRRNRRLSEKEFEKALWERLQSLHDKDVWRGFSYDKRVNPDPQSPHFSFSLAGRAFFVIGLHANASRPGRRFPHSALVFNLHEQFEMLRNAGRYQRLKSAIMDRDQKFNGSINPMLASHGEISEARQYSGRNVSGLWRCPLHVHSENALETEDAA